MIVEMIRRVTLISLDFPPSLEGGDAGMIWPLPRASGRFMWALRPCVWAKVSSIIDLSLCGNFEERRRANH